MLIPLLGEVSSKVSVVKNEHHKGHDIDSIVTDSVIEVTRLNERVY